MRHLVVPALLAPWRGSGALPRLPALELLLARADREAVPAGETALFDLFGVPADYRHAAPWSRFGLTGELTEACVIQAEPVHFYPDRDRLLFFSVAAVSLSAARRKALAELFNRHFAADGLRLEVTAGDSWFLLSDRCPEVTFTALLEAEGRDLNGCLPRGGEAGYWRGLLNEAQMLFFQQDETDGGLAVNGLWFSSAGRLPRLPELAPVRCDPPPESALARGLCAAATDAEAGRSVGFYEAIERARRLGDDQEMNIALEKLDQMLAPLLRQPLTLHDLAGHRWVWRPAMRRRFWRRFHPPMVSRGAV